MGEAADNTSQQDQQAQTPRWPRADGRRVVFLLDCCGGDERRILERWIDEHRPADVPAAGIERVCLPPSRRPAEWNKIDPQLEVCLAADDDPLMAPLRVAWMPPPASPRTWVRLLSLLLLGDPYDPSRLRRRWILARAPERCRVVVGEPAPASDLRRRWREAGGSDAAETTGLAEFVARQAALALERAERGLRGTRYKVPRFVHESILARPAFRGGLARLAWELGRDVADVTHEASGYLREIAATHSPYMIDIAAQVCRLLYSQGYGKLDYDRSELERVYAVAQRYPVVFLPSHKSNLDHLVLQYALYENGHPPNHTAGGINMNFFPMGPVFRRSGVFFIRRTFRDNEVYKFVLRHYIDYLVEKRFPLEWYLEGGRSRSGKLLPPRFGMLAYVVDSYRRGKSEDVYLLPVSIAYDRIHEVGAYAAEQRGGGKEREGFRWFLRVLRLLRRRYGGIYIRLGEPLSLREALGPPEPARAGDPDERSLEVQKLAFEVSVRINRVTPITPTSLVTLALLAAGDRALTLDETVAALGNWLAYVERRRLPTTEKLALDRREGVEAELEALVEHGVVSCFSGGPEAVYTIGPDQQLAAAYYRNTVIHFFIGSAIAELALLRASEEDVSDRQEEFFAEALRLRDLLKFEFFFPEKDEFRTEIERELSLHDPEWRAAMGQGAEGIRDLITRFKPFNAHLMLRPFLEAYRVVGDALERLGDDEEPDGSGFIDRCLGLGRQYHLQKRIRSAESVSKVLFTSALSLARNRGVTDPGPDAGERRRAFAEQIRDTIRRIDAIDALAASRRAGLIR
ncbi:MAG: glycerol-3-phosphate 1-O-acyltransferase [Deltaproteobacteria bacterium]|nr:MAG: glycerol-3-phosphate 1-O-acyltransferase [Deltaproteobacteria bacterium]